MSRWEPDAQGRLERAAYELFRDRGYEETTVADIAERAGLTERTFFRYYTDKREVLFGGAGLLRDELVRAIESAPPDLPPIEAVRVAIETMSMLMGGRLALARERRKIISAHPDLQERELNKRFALTAAVEESLQRKGVAGPTASLAAEMGLAVFHVGFAHWLDDPADRELSEIVRSRFDELKSLARGIEPQK